MKSTFEKSIINIWSNATTFDNWRTTAAILEGIEIAYNLEGKNDEASDARFLHGLAIRRMYVQGMEDCGISVTANENSGGVS